ncbi:MAG TPA: putative PEP-binding protein, partial [Chitinivibrionales bacterium]
KMPLIMADNPALLGLTESSTLLMDAETGNLYVNPTPAIRAPFEKRKQRWSGAKVMTEQAPAESVTLDGYGFSLLANINLISDVDDANAVYAEGIGLYRSEFPFIIRNCFPTEEEQYAVYSTLVRKNGKKPVTLRTLDIGGDKVLSYYAEFKERNPFLGMRSMRFCLQHPDVFKQQLRAILRAGAGADLRIMFPMISSLDEFQDALSVLSECTSELHGEAAVFHASPLVGVMIELPAVLDILDSLADKADFFSIGTNDLIQYLLGVDRTNEKVASYYCPHHPSVLRFIKHTADAARKAGIGVTVCGDMAHDPRYARFFLGVGISSLSVDPLYIPTLRTALRSVSLVGARENAEALLQCTTIRDTRELISPAD